MLHMTKERVLIASTLVGPERRLTLPGFFRIFQDVAGHDAEVIGAGKANTMDKGILWVFTRVSLEIVRMPNYMEEVDFVTFTGPRKSFIFPRFGEVRDLEGNVLIRLNSLWALIDEKSRHVILRPTIEQPDFTDGKEYPLPDRIVPEEAEEMGRHTIRYCDVDLNGHLNNVRYIEMIANLFPMEFFLNNDITQFTINYEAEIHGGDEVVLEANPQKTYIRGVVDSKTHFEAKLAYSKRVVE